MSRRSGTLQLTTPAQAGEIVFRVGKVVAVYRNDASETCGEGLMRAGVLTPAQYQEMMTAQAQGTVAAALFKSFELTSEAFEAAQEELLKRMVYGMFEWKEGTFSFVLEEQPDPWRGFAIDNGRVVVERGLNPQYLAIEGARLRDEHEKNEPPPDLAALQAESAANPLAALSSHNKPSGGDDDWSTLHLDGPPATSAPLMSAPAPAAPHAPDDDASDKVIPFPGPHRAPRRDGTQSGSALALQTEQAPQPEAAPQPATVEPAPVAQASPEPVAEPAPVAEPTPDEPMPAALPEAAPAPGWHLLVIDDDSQVLQHVRDALAPRFASVTLSNTVSDTLALLVSAPSNVVIAADLIIARSDGKGILGGVEILEYARQNKPELPFILFSDYQNEEAEARARGLGVAALLMKPRKAQIHADGKRGGVTPPMRDFLVRLEAALAPYLAVPPPIAAAETAGEAPPTVVSPPAPLPQPAPSAPARPEANPAAEGTYDLRSELAAALAETPLPDVPIPPMSSVSPGEMAVLRSMIAELRDPSSRDAVTLLVLRFASSMFERAALFLATRRAYVGLGGFSVTEGSDSFVLKVRRVQVPTEAPSLLADISQYRVMIRAPLAPTDGNKRLLTGLGGDWHAHDVVAAPLISGDRVAAILFGDNPSGKPLGVTDGLEIFLQQAGLVMERALLERKLEETRRREPGKP